MICSHGQKNEVVVLGSVSAGNAAFDQRVWGCGVVSRRGGHRIGCSAGGCFSGNLEKLRQRFPNGFDVWASVNRKEGDL